jgi:hypothetical protein
MIGNVQATDPSSLPLIDVSDLRYSGAFALPLGGKEGLAFNPANNSLYVVCSKAQVAEVDIPEPIKSTDKGSLNIAAVRQNCADITEGNFNPQNIVNGMILGGLLVDNDRLVGAEWAYYDGEYKQTLSHFYHSKTVSQTGTYRGHYQLNAPHAAYVGGYMAPIPPEWQASLGGKALTGHCCTSIISQQSMGPSAFAFNPDDLGNKDPVPASPLVYYSLSHPTLGGYATSGPPNPVYCISTLITGVVFPNGTRSVIFFGSTGLGEPCYGEGGSNGKCFDPVDPYKGTHAYPYAYYIWMYDVNDFVAVYKKKKKPWDVRPYYHGVLDLPFTPAKSRQQLNGAAFDPATGRIYVSQDDAMVVHVYELQVSDGTGMIWPPTNLKTGN